MASYLIPLFTIKSATPAASAKVGISRPIWLNVREKLEARVRESCALDLSPIIATGESAEPPFSPALMERRVAFETEEWIPPHRPLSEEITMKSLRVGAPSGLAFWKTSTG